MTTTTKVLEVLGVMTLVFGLYYLLERDSQKTPRMGIEAAEWEIKRARVEANMSTKLTWLVAVWARIDQRLKRLMP